jgi:dihydroorotate dehydrogenase
MYKIIRSVLFLFDPEQVHYFAMNCLKFLSQSGLKKLVALSFKPRIGTSFSLAGMQFSNRVGLGAGFDKNALYLNELETLGFGFVEIGTVTPLPQGGNDKPRLFRLPKDQALINRMGFNNDGVKIVSDRLREWRLANSRSKLIIGGNIGKNKITPNDEAWKDYETCFLALHDHVDYFVVNVSSPNTPGLRELQEKDSLAKILKNLQLLNAGKVKAKPIFLKIAPDLTTEQIDDVIELALEIKLDGLVACNTTISREGLNSGKSLTAETGGLSGLPVRDKSTRIVEYIHQRTNGQVTIIASGGIFTGQDAKDKIDAGAALVQVWTGFIYEGPKIVKNITRHIGNYQRKPS